MIFVFFASRDNYATGSCNSVTILRIATRIDIEVEEFAFQQENVFSVMPNCSVQNFLPLIISSCKREALRREKLSYDTCVMRVCNLVYHTYPRPNSCFLVTTAIAERPEKRSCTG